MVEVLGFAVLLGYLQASIANMQDHRQPSLTILDFGFWILDWGRKREIRKRGASGDR